MSQLAISFRVIQDLGKSDDLRDSKTLFCLLMASCAVDCWHRDHNQSKRRFEEVW